MRHITWTALRLFGLAAMALTAAATPGSAQRIDDVAIVISPSSGSVLLGENLDLSISVTNHAAAASPPMVVHLDITNPEQSTSVDPEDWTPTLSKRIGVVAPGDTVVVDWSVQPISAGTFFTYAVALSPGSDTLAASNAVEVRVVDQRSLNPGGILPVAIAAPTLIGLLLLGQMRSARRRHTEPIATSL